MGLSKIAKVKKDIENISSTLTATDAQEIFYDIVFKKKVEQGIKEANAGKIDDWNAFKKEIRSWYKSK